MKIRNGETGFGPPVILTPLFSSRFRSCGVVVGDGGLELLLVVAELAQDLEAVDDLDLRHFPLIDVCKEYRVGDLPGKATLVVVDHQQHEQGDQCEQRDQRDPVVERQLGEPGIGASWALANGCSRLLLYAADRDHRAGAVAFIIGTPCAGHIPVTERGTADCQHTSTIGDHGDHPPTRFRCAPTRAATRRAVLRRSATGSHLRADTTAPGGVRQPIRSAARWQPFVRQRWVPLSVFRSESPVFYTIRSLRPLQR